MSVDGFGNQVLVKNIRPQHPADQTKSRPNGDQVGPFQNKVWSSFEAFVWCNAEQAAHTCHTLTNKLAFPANCPSFGHVGTMLTFSSLDTDTRATTATD